MFISIILGTLSGFVAAPVMGAGALAVGTASAFSRCSKSSGGYSSCSFSDASDVSSSPKKSYRFNSRSYIKYIDKGFVIGMN